MNKEKKSQQNLQLVFYLIQQKCKLWEYTLKIIQRNKEWCRFEKPQKASRKKVMKIFIQVKVLAVSHKEPFSLL